MELPFPDDDFYFWIWQHDRPTVVPLDIRSITSVFRDGNLGVLLFLEERNFNKSSEFKTAAENWKKSNNKNLIFIAVTVNLYIFRKDIKIFSAFWNIWILIRFKHRSLL